MDPYFEGNVWYATKERFYSHAWFRATDDKGTLSITDKIVHFKGKRRDFEMHRIRDVSVVKQRFDVVTFNASVLTGFIWAYILDFFTGEVFELNLYIFLFITLPISLIFALVFRQRWICVKYGESDGQLHEAFFMKRWLFRNPETSELFSQLSVFAQ